MGKGVPVLKVYTVIKLETQINYTFIKSSSLYYLRMKIFRCCRQQNDKNDV